MKKEQLSDALNLLDDDMLEETDRLRTVSRGIRVQEERQEEKTCQVKARRKWDAGKIWQKRTAAATVCLVLAAVLGSGFYGSLQEHSRLSGGDRTEDSAMSSVENPQNSRSGGQGANAADGSGDSRLDGGEGAQAGNSFPDGADGSGDSSSNGEQGSENTTGLSQLPVTKSDGGFDGYKAYDASEMVNANPWTEEMEISALPVYHSAVVFHGQYGINLKPNLNKMEEYLTEVAGRLGLDTDSLVITDDVPDEETRKIIMEKLQAGGTVPDGYFSPTKLVTEAGGMRIEVDQYMTAFVYFEPAVELPAEYRFDHSASHEELEKTAGYLEQEFTEFMGMEQPRQDITGGGYNSSLQQQYEIAFYEAGEDAVEQILQYNFNRVSFACDDEGKLFLARIYRPDISRKEGEYPVITAQEARELLRDGNYITTLPGEMPGEEYVRAVELVYRMWNWGIYYMPYYCFTVELPNPYSDTGGEKEDGLKSYGMYYVPAVESEYLADMPGWDGSFN